ncbi:hypothetical protein LZ31DRAFT_50646 [Colletotrichum somersetense]|nr:hypothetical protein LZ31DRAFT_50646 [Colletotrichum somersetense]
MTLQANEGAKGSTGIASAPGLAILDFLSLTATAGTSLRRTSVRLRSKLFHPERHICTRVTRPFRPTPFPLRKKKKRGSTLGRFHCGTAHEHCAMELTHPTASVNSGLKGYSEGRASWERRVETSVTLKAGSVSGCASGLLGEPRRWSEVSWLDDDGPSVAL